VRESPFLWVTLRSLRDRAVQKPDPVSSAELAATDMLQRIQLLLNVDFRFVANFALFRL
jgi:hypothetical protein